MRLGLGSAGRRPGLDGTGSWQCRPKAGTGTGDGTELSAQNDLREHKSTCQPLIMTSPACCIDRNSSHPLSKAGTGRD
eukprot:5011839-Prymnesium_polylepis.1